MPLAARWRLLDSGAADGPTNMALDHALLDRAAASDEAVLRVYAWSRPTLSFGMHERATISAAALAAHGVDVVRRPTGGRALLHHREVTYSVTAPAQGATLRDAFRAINVLLLDALRRLGVPAEEAAPRARTARPEGAACFAEPNAGELVLGGRKLVGSAQRRDEHALLQHGSILLADDQPMITTLRGRPGEVLPPAATLEGALGRPVTYDEVRDALAAALGAAADENVAPLAVHSLSEGVSPHLVRYRSAEWTWRR